MDPDHGRNIKTLKRPYEQKDLSKNLQPYLSFGILSILLQRPYYLKG